MRWLLLVLVLALSACIGGESPQKASAPQVEKPAGTVQPVAPSANLSVPEPVQAPKKEGVSVRELLPATVMDYTNMTFHCTNGTCTGTYRSRLLGNNNSVQVDFYDESNKYKRSPLPCDPANARVSEVRKNRTIVWCNETSTKERVVSSLWWSEPELGYVSIASEERTRAFSDSTRAKNSDFAANSTAIYVTGRIDYFASAGKAAVLKE